MDDCSTEAITKELMGEIENISKSNRIRALSTKVNSGAGVARNVGLDNSNYDYIAFCDADDW